ncbi:membrane protein [Sphingomonas sp. DBB INV C78]|uniref:MAPEG family protein n=1 Tax=Sphingomonas sp. DBB INV C78 TaxID=3349434 RepID=UPI0036D2D388
MTHPMLAPVVALILWSMVMWAWLYATRLPAMMRLKIVYDPLRPKAEFLDRIPPRVTWKADNYNHLMEQPTLFYAVAITLAIVAPTDVTNIALAWGYVGLRVVHSLVQALVNHIPARFMLFMLGSILLLALAIRAACVVF